MTYAETGICVWCGSAATGLATGHMNTWANTRLGVGYVPREQPDVWAQIHYQPQFRLSKGFSILNGGEV